MSAAEQQQAQPPPEPGEPDPAHRYEAVVPHWFYRRVTEGRERWVPFSAQDSERLEEAHGSGRARTASAGGCPPGRESPSPPPRVGGGSTAPLAFSSHRCYF